jgi:chromosome segregation ATPase
MPPKKYQLISAKEDLAKDLVIAQLRDELDSLRLQEFETTETNEMCRNLELKVITLREEKDDLESQKRIMTEENYKLIRDFKNELDFTTKLTSQRNLDQNVLLSEKKDIAQRLNDKLSSTKRLRSEIEHLKSATQAANLKTSELIEANTAKDLENSDLAKKYDE